MYRSSAADIFLEHIAPWHRLQNRHFKHVYQGF
jgi:hypothetical protein